MADGSEITSLAAAHGIRSGGNGWINAGLPLGINSMVIQSKRSPCSTTVSTEIGSLSWCSNVMPPNSGGNVSTSSITVGLGSGQLGDSASSTPDSINFAGLPVDNTIWSEDVLRSGRFYESMQNMQGNLHEGLYRRALKQEKVEEVLRRPSWELMGNFTSFQEQEDKSVCESSDLRYDPHDLADDRRVGCCNRKLSDLAGSWSLAAADLSVNTLADIQMPYEGLAEGNGSQGFEPQIYKGEDFPYGLDVSFAKSVTAGNNHSQSGGAIIAAEADDPGVLWAPCSSTSNIILPGGLSPAAVPPPPSKLQSTVLSIPLGEKHLCDLSSSTSYRAAVPQPYNSHPNGSSSPRYNNTPQKPEGNQLNNITQRLNLPFDVDKARDSRTHDAPVKSITTESSTTSSFKRPRLQTSPAPLPTFKVRKEKLGDRITTLQQLVSPFGKTDTASVLLEAVGYIKFLHEQVRILSTPYMNSGGNSAQAARHQLVPWGSSDNNDSDESKPDLRSRGLCLVPLSSTFDVGDDTNATDCCTLPFIECNYR